MKTELGIKVEGDAQLLERKDKDPQGLGEESATTCKRGCFRSGGRQ